MQNVAHRVAGFLMGRIHRRGRFDRHPFHLFPGSFPFCVSPCPILYAPM